ncbi:DUF6090 family protein [Winogradskyella aurantia]|uniref:Uncharacterized protein n=1 Tax=Winogradskyella aurantia TaxID=1915063 RepID=A0A265UM34_9FLAO|nr:DUF6090 family protein [Winogradskyella aurantia]OZV66396.1 hypothetical protein CA834_14425 [Winogradskyella aurantia]
MIKFFRKIRQRLLSENKFSKYLFYAVGEIVLVVIGILIALQINNANTHRKETQTLRGYLSSIKNNIASDKKQIEAIISFRDSVKVYSQKIVQLSKQDKILLKDFLLVIDDDYNVFYDQYLEINPSGFEALKNSGYLGMIQGSKIENLINDYYLVYNIIKRQEKSLNDFIENMEVLGFEEQVFTKIINILRKPDAEEYFLSNQDKIKAIINHPSIQGANLRGSLVEGLFNKYKKLLSIGQQLSIEINKIVENHK